MLRVRDKDVPGLEERSHGMGAGRLAAVRLHGDNAGNGVFQRVDDRRAVGLVLHQLAGGAGPFGGQRAEGGDRVREPHTPPYLIEEVAVGPLAAPHLPHNKVGIVAVLERHIPRDKELVELLRQVFGEPEAQPLGFENGAAVGRGPLLVQGLPVAGAEGLLDGEELLQRVAFRVQGFPGLAVGLVFRGDGGEVHHAPVIALPPRRRFEQPPREVGHVPAGVDDEDAPAGREARVQRGRVPVPDVLADGRGIGGRPIFEWVVDDSAVVDKDTAGKEVLITCYLDINKTACCSVYSRNVGNMSRLYCSSFMPCKILWHLLHSVIKFVATLLIGIRSM